MNLQERWQELLAVAKTTVEYILKEKVVHDLRIFSTVKEKPLHNLQPSEEHSPGCRHIIILPYMKRTLKAGEGNVGGTG